MRSNHAFVTDADRCRLGSLLTNPEYRAWGTRRRRAKLYSFLEDSTPIRPVDAPDTLVTMNTTVEIVDPRSGDRDIVTLVYPQDSGVVSNGVSVLKPLGIALIGSQVGDAIEWTDRRGKHNMRVARILHQPEHAGLWHL
jgi:regulator of nucleoside diphosphate kinase